MDSREYRSYRSKRLFGGCDAGSELQIAVGTIASDIDQNPTLPIVVPDVLEGATPDRDFVESVAALIEQAERLHPSVAAAQAQLEAAVAKEAQTRAEGLPTISFIGKYSRNNQPATLGLGQPSFPATGHDWYFGIQVQVPLFEGFSRVYKTREAHAQVEVQRSTLDKTKQQVGLDVWKSYQSLQTDTQNLQNTEMLLQIARKSFVAARHRYNAGVGNILELLSAQSSLSDANRQRIQALTDWRAARLQLAAKIGRLGIQDLGLAVGE
ncbi:TolC family protein [Burkholderia sp. Bp9143]|uniref:TolC family protein n=1 Tax=Burkholderia sp. Bp9143 TaxID=2184574 RepID=UPI0021AB5D4D|nr:TolC family protein [Burkholderia sp. Bp9143]